MLESASALKHEADPTATSSPNRARIPQACKIRRKAEIRGGYRSVLPCWAVPGGGSRRIAVVPGAAAVPCECLELGRPLLLPSWGCCCAAAAGAQGLAP